MEGEDVVVGVGLDEGVEVGSVLLEWCFEKCGFGDECLLELVSCSVVLDVVKEVVMLGADEEEATGFDRPSFFSGSFFLFLL